MAQGKYEYVAKGKDGDNESVTPVTLRADSDSEAWKVVRDKLKLYDAKLYREVDNDS